MADILNSLGWALLHSVWQGIIALGLIFFIQVFAKTCSPSMRYTSYMMVLIGTFVAFLTTFCFKLKAATAPFQNYITGTDPNSLLSNASFSEVLTGATDQFLFMGSTLNISSDLSLYVPVIAIIWCIGFLLQSSRYAVAFALTQRLRRRGLIEPSAPWARRFKTIAANSGLNHSVKLYVSKYIQSPMTMGFVKPVVLVPVGFLTRLPQDQVEAILLHEIAHIRRYDYALNLLQMAIKSVFFFHPAIHYVSRLIDIEREQACDDLAVAQGHNPKALALGLASLQLDLTEQAFAMSAHGRDKMPLLNRLQRLTSPVEKRQRPEQIILSALTALILGGIYFGTAQASIDSQTPNEAPQAIRPAKTFEANVSKPTYKNNAAQEKVRQALYKQLIKDGLIESDKDIAKLSPYGKSWKVNGTLVPRQSQDSYCALVSQLKVQKSDLKTIKLSPKYIRLSLQDETPRGIKAREVTYGEFTHTQKSDGLIHLVKSETRSENSVSKFNLPINKADVTAPYGMTGKLWPTKHLGIDFRGETGDPVYASAKGKVLTVTDEGGYGKRVTIRHKDGVITTYSHMNSISVKPRDIVNAKDVIGTVGSTGKSTGPHLHFEIIKDGQKIDPKSYIF